MAAGLRVFTAGDGARRVGKTTLLQMLHRERLQENEPTAIYSLDDPTAQAIFGDPSTARLGRVLSELGFDPQRRNYLFLDEIQGLPHIDLLLKLIFDHFPHVKVLAASSSSLLLLQGLTDSLAGRKYFVELLPLTLGEYAGIQVDDYFSFPESITQQGRLNEVLHSFSVYGSYPDVVGKTTVEEKQLIASILKRNLYAQRPFNAYFWRTYQGYEIDLVLESNQTQEFWNGFFKNEKAIAKAPPQPLPSALRAPGRGFSRKLGL